MQGTRTPLAVLVASNNAHKLEELHEIMEMAGAGSVQLVTPRTLGLSLDPVEDAPTYLGNAQIKAREFAQVVAEKSLGPLYVMADDSGLEVDALDGRPGLLSNRYFKASPNGDGCAEMLRELQQTPDAQRTARFRCTIVVVAPDGGEHDFEGVCEGRIVHAKRGAREFGFDPIFVPNGDERTFAELPSAAKHVLSHRGIATRKAAEYLLARVSAA